VVGATTTTYAVVRVKNGTRTWEDFSTSNRAKPIRSYIPGSSISSNARFDLRAFVHRG